MTQVCCQKFKGCLIFSQADAKTNRNYHNHTDTFRTQLDLLAHFSVAVKLD